MQNRKTKIIFAGTPAFALPYLEGLISESDFEIAGVITQPDRPSGRKQILTPSPVADFAASRGLTVWKPEKMVGDTGLQTSLKSAGADLLVVVAYGQIIPQNVLDIFAAGCINVHPSLLPKYRGASPIQNAILNGDKKTGVSIMLMDSKMDHGPLLAQQEVDMNGTETNESLHQDLASLGVPLLTKTIKDYIAGIITPAPQDESQATYCKMITREMGRIDWTDSASDIDQKIRAFYPWPATWTIFDGQRVKIFPPLIVEAEATAEVGSLQSADNRLAIACGTGRILIEHLQLEGKKEISAAEFIRGHQELQSLKFE